MIERIYTDYNNEKTVDGKIEELQEKINEIIDILNQQRQEYDVQLEREKNFYR